jgi:hypothetical protein
MEESREERIEKYENISNRRRELIKKLTALLDQLEAQDNLYDQLLAYYYSDMWQDDVEADAAGIVDPNLARGVLAEDTIYDLMTDHHALAIRLLDMATDMLR